MKAIFLKLQVLVFLSSLLSLAVQAQAHGFISIQSENKQSFYVKIDKSFLSSSQTGYIIMPKLVEGPHNFSIGFSKNEWPELHGTFNVKDINAEFLLKNFAYKGWDLVNLQTGVSMAPEKQSPINTEMKIISTVDEFATMLAEVVNDPSIAELTSVQNTSATSVSAAEGKSLKTPKVNELIDAIPVNLKTKKSKIDKIEIAKLKQDSTTQGLLIEYVDFGNFFSDTVKVFIPVNQSTKTTAIKKQTEFTEEGSKKKNKRFIDMELQNPNQKIDSGMLAKEDFMITEKMSENPMAIAEQGKKILLNTDKVLIKSQCKKTATQNDFLKLHKQMTAEISESNMIKSASKQFVNTCFTTEQIKNLALLFITEDEKYKFFVAAFLHVSDTQNFETLEEQLTNNYYKVRFKAMLNH